MHRNYRLSLKTVCTTFIITAKLINIQLKLHCWEIIHSVWSWHVLLRNNIFCKSSFREFISLQDPFLTICHLQSCCPCHYQRLWDHSTIWHVADIWSLKKSTGLDLLCCTLEFCFFLFLLYLALLSVESDSLSAEASLLHRNSVFQEPINNTMK